VCEFQHNALNLYQILAAYDPHAAKTRNHYGNGDAGNRILYNVL